MLGLALIAVPIVPQPDGVLVEHCAEIECNHYYDHEGKLIFDQILFREPNRDIRAWRLIKQPGQIPTRNWQTGGYVVTWMDGEQLRRVYADSMQHSWSQQGFEGDPEVNEREVLPKENRRELRVVRRAITR